MNYETQEQNYIAMFEATKELLSSEQDEIANLANISAIIKMYVDDCNWAGFYIYNGSELVLGPFQGLPACIRITLGRGVCGWAAQKRQVIIVDDVHTFDGHIACDSNSNSEIVLPIICNGNLYGVLDLDSPSLGRFSELEKKYLSLVVQELQVFLSSLNITP